MAQIPTVDVAELRSDDAAVRKRVRNAILDAFGTLGILHIGGHDMDPSALDALYDSFQRFAALPESEKAPLSRPDLWFQRGWTPPNTEKAVVGDGKPDYKECYFACCTEADPHAAQLFPQLYADNVWPHHDPAFSSLYTRVASELQQLGRVILAACEHALNLPTLSLVSAVRGGAHVTRLLRYLPLDETALAHKPLWSETHTDFNLLTLLPGGRFVNAHGGRCEQPADAGMFQRTRPSAEHPRGELVSGRAPDGHVVAQVGQQLEILTGGTLLATPHEIRAPDVPGVSHLALAHFLHCHPSLELFPLEAFRTPDVVARYRPPILAGTYAIKTLHDIGLAPPEALDLFGYRNYERLI